MTLDAAEIRQLIERMSNDLSDAHMAIQLAVELLVRQKPGDAAAAATLDQVQRAVQRADRAGDALRSLAETLKR